MHVKAKTMAFGGILLALSVICMALGSVIETSTLFLLAAASYFVGIVIREFGMKAGAAFYLADVLLGFLLAPNKFYVLSFAAMGLYILFAEGIWRLAGKREKMQKKSLIWILKYILFNVMYIPVLFAFQELLFGGRTFSGGFLALVFVAGQIGLFVYDRAYVYMQREIWSRYRGRLLR
ncbi:hypothetical protein [Lachnoclostridium sp. An181]|uniref:hypothetical protein n=1 Tax=Lachnoclostridium sp. An181 TaxID=1965575 RepID=UPI000B371368|nr:hypothetical protein [Lachnoclostridium sp. An181]OUP50083.1 hypothetical protein B5F18_04580 [Lachnoclostridium sp. An181]